MLSFVTIVSLKAIIYVASLGIFAGNLWLFKDNVYTFTHLLATSRNDRSMSPFDSPASIANGAGPIVPEPMLPSFLTEPSGDDGDVEEEDEYDYNGWEERFEDQSQHPFTAK